MYWSVSSIVLVDVVPTEPLVVINLSHFIAEVIVTIVAATSSN